MIQTYNFAEQDKVGKMGEQLILKHYNTLTDETGNKYHARPTRMSEQLQGADIWVFNQELKDNYIEVKTDTQIQDTNNVALEYLIEQENGELQIGCQMKTFADFMMYWTYPTNFVRFWKPRVLQPYLLTWIKEDKYRTIKVINENAEGKKWFAHCLLVPVSEFDKLSFVKNFLVSMDIVESIIYEKNL